MNYIKKGEQNMNLSLSGGIIVAIGGIAPAISIGVIGLKAVEATGRNPEASGKIMINMLMAMAFAEAIAIYSLIATIF
jgi:F-type H+-transporting ATPase subunit c